MDFDYLLPPEQIATRPEQRRDDSRLMRLDRFSGARNHAHFRDLTAWLPPRSLVVLNDARVIPARLRGSKESGGSVELLLTRKVSREASGDEPTETWEALAKNLGRGDAQRLGFPEGLTAEVLERRGEGRVLLRFAGLGTQDLLAKLEQIGELPLPPYIEAARKRSATEGARRGGGAGESQDGDRRPDHDLDDLDDRRRYQTVYATTPGAVAAPTAGLHFTPELLQQIERSGHQIARLTLHVGPGTFRPVKTDRPSEHVMDVEHFDIPAATAAAIAGARAARRAVVAIGTTVVRALEAAVRDGRGEIRPGPGATALFLLPGDEFQVVTDLVTNFHLPRSTLLMLVSAFAGRDLILDAYRAAVAEGYRFYSYGDAMLITGRSAP
jgi:S-adenosylmethionine:tRNA ribosyltransferase-isomerase